MIRTIVILFLLLSCVAGCSYDAPSPEPTGFFCSDCGREIASGQTYWCFSVNHEVFEEDAVEVLESTMVELYCEDCAGKRDFNNTSVPLKR